MKFKFFFAASGLGVMLMSCASLTKSQIGAVNQFSQTSSNFSAYPGKIMTELAEIRLSRSVYAGSTFSDARLNLENLDGIHEQYTHDVEVSQKLDVTFKIIDKYAQSLLLLSSDKFETDIEEQAKNFGVGLDSLITLNNSIQGARAIPAGIGEAAGKLIALGGKQYVRSRQSKEIKKYVAAADTLIAIMTMNLLEHLGSKHLEELIANEEKGLKADFKTFLGHSKSTPEHGLAYVRLQLRLKNVRALQKQTMQATKDLRLAHKKLKQEIEKKKKIKEAVKEIQTLYEEVKEIKETIRSIETNKTAGK